MVSRADLGADTQRASKATTREWVGLAVISLPCLLYSMDRTVLNLAVPRISAELQPASSELLWIVDIYGFVLAGLLVTMGTLGDRIGRRCLLLIGASVFGAASILAALSTSSLMLIAARALLGVGGAALAPSTLSLIRHMFLDSSQRAFAIGIWATSYSVGGAIGPLIGGLLLQRFGWGSVFWIGVPVMMVLLIVGPVLLPEYKSPAAGRMDLISALQSLAAVLLVTYGLKQVATSGWQPMAAVAMTVGVAAGISFVRRQRRLQSRLIDLSLLRSSTFTTALLAYMLGCFVISAISLFTAQYLQHVLGLSPLQAGLWTLPATLGFVIGSMLAPLIARLMSAAPAMSAGLLLAALGLGILAQMESILCAEFLGIGLFVLSLGLAPVFTRAIGLMIETVPPERSGEVSAISEAGSELGAALGIAVLGSVGTAIYRSVIASTMPSGIGPEAAEVARATIGGALSLTHALPEHLSGPLLNSARAAFQESFRMATTLSACFVISMAIVVILLGRVRHGKAANYY